MNLTALNAQNCPARVVRRSIGSHSIYHEVGFTMFIASLIYIVRLLEAACVHIWSANKDAHSSITSIYFAQQNKENANSSHYKGQTKPMSYVCMSNVGRRKSKHHLTFPLKHTESAKATYTHKSHLNQVKRSEHLEFIFGECFNSCECEHGMWVSECEQWQNPERIYLFVIFWRLGVWCFSGRDSSGTPTHKF